jgi:hypothetical protein
MKATNYTAAFKKTSIAADKVERGTEQWMVLMNTWDRLRNEAVLEGYSVVFNHAQDKDYWVV